MIYLKNLFLIVLFITFLSSSISLSEENRITTFKESDVHFSLTKDSLNSDKYELEVKRESNPLSNLDVFSLLDPTRIVVDIPGSRTNTARNIRIDDSNIKSIRIGIHPSKLRIVIDLTKDKTPFISVNKITGNVYKVQFSPSENVKKEIKEKKPQEEDLSILKETKKTKKVIQKRQKIDFIREPKNKFSITPKVKPITKPDDVIKMKEEEKEKAKKVASKTKKSSNIKRKPTSQVLDGITFELCKRTKKPSIVLLISNLGKYSIIRTTKNIYELTLKNASLKDNNLLLPQFPPTTYKELQLVSAREKGKDIIVRIYVGDSVSLEVDNKKNKLCINVKK